MPHTIRAAAQSLLTHQWMHRVPLVQKQSPAALASTIILNLLAQLETDAPNPCHFEILDFCSGSGGPISSIEALVNASRAAQGKPAVDFVLSDLHPPLQDWEALERTSPHIRYVPRPVDATNPPPPMTPSPHEQLVRKRIHLFCLSFHHFDDEAAYKILRNTVNNADAFAVLELQERRLSSVLMMVLLGLSVFHIVLLHYWRRPAFLFWTWIMPVLPALLWFDGTVSSLRTRTIEEMKGLVSGAIRERREKRVWRVEGRREVHSWPLGYLTGLMGWRAV